MTRTAITRWATASHHATIRFTKGQSGNPRGWAPGAKNLKTLLVGALYELVVVTENGGRRTISKGQAIIKQIVNQSAKGDWRAANCCPTG